MTRLTRGTGTHRLRHGTLIAALLASTALAGLPAGVAKAQDATWSPNPVSLDFDNATNWVSGVVPTGTATFGASTTSSSIVVFNPRTMAGWTFTAGHTGYGFLAFGALTFTGAGISNAGTGVALNAYGALTFRNASATSGININGFSTTEFLDNSRAGGSIHNFAALNFRDSSSAGAASITNFGAVSFSGSSSAGSATINGVSGTTVTFDETSTAGSATISNAFSATTTFNNSASAGSAEITNVWSGGLIFNDSSTAGAATIINFDSGITTFNGSSTAGSATIYNHLNASLTFNGSSTAGAARIFTSGAAQFSGASTAASATITNYGSLAFLDNATAGAATISNTTTDPALIATLNFKDSSTAGTASITNGPNSNLLFQDASTAGGATITNSGSLIFRNNATAGSASIDNSMFLQFSDSSSAGSAGIANSNVTSFFGSSTAATAMIANTGILNFWNTSTAASATITNSGCGSLSFLGSSTAGGAAIASSGWTSFRDASSAGTSSITTSGYLFFSDSSTAGSATIANSGYLDFSNASSTGNATITTRGQLNLATTDLTGAATVTVQSGGVMMGYGSVGNTTVEAGGTILAALGTLRVNGNLSLSAGSQFYACSCAQISATGTTTLGGATLFVPQASFQAQGHTILTATGGVNGTFSSAGLSPLISILYGTNDVTVSIAAYTTDAALGGIGGTNARNVGGALDRVLDASGGAPPASLYPLLGLYGAPLAQAMNGLSGEAATGAQASAFAGASTFLGIMLDPMAGARGATASAPGSSLVEMADTGRTPAARVAAGWSVWTKSFGQAGRTASDATTGAAGTASSLYGVAAGADRLISSDTLVGFALAGGGTTYGLGTRGTGSGDFAQLGFYGSTRLGPAYVSAALAYGWNRFDVSRTAGLGPLETYRSAPTVHTFGGRIEAGRRFGDRALAATPYAAIEVIGASTAGYRESWAAPDTGAFALAYAARTSATGRAEAGVRLDSLRVVAPTADLITFARLAYGYQAGTQRAAEASFQQLANSGFTVFGARASTHTALGALGAELRLASGTRLTGSLDAELGDRHRALRANLGLRQSW